MAMCRSGLLLRLNAKSSSCVVRQPKVVRATGKVCLLLRTCVARVHMLLNGIDLEQPPSRNVSPTRVGPNDN